MFVVYIFCMVLKKGNQGLQEMATRGEGIFGKETES